MLQKTSAWPGEDALQKLSMDNVEKNIRTQNLTQTQTQGKKNWICHKQVHYI